MRRIVLVFAFVVGTLLGLGFPVSGLGLVSVTLTCSDGTSVTMNVDTDTLNSLTDSVNAMALYPAGLSCTLVQNPVPLTSLFGNVAIASSGDSFIVGGGRWQVPCSAILAGAPPPPPPPPPPSAPASSNTTDVLIWVNIAVNFHLRVPGDPTSAYGSLNETIPANQGPCDSKQVGESHFTAKPTCFTLDSSQPAIAYTTSQVTQASDGSGQVPFPAPATAGKNGAVPGVVSVNDFVHFGFQDNGNPPGMNPSSTITPTTDMLNGPPASPPGTQSSACNTSEWPPTFHLGAFDGSKQYGNLTLHL
jgi:hypothetical protein